VGGSDSRGSDQIGRKHGTTLFHIASAMAHGRTTGPGPVSDYLAEMSTLATAI
jgi:hypothetical protein